MSVSTPLQLSLLTYTRSSGVTRRDGGVAGEVDETLRACEAVLREMVPTLPSGTDAYIAHIKHAVETEPITIVIASVEEEKNVVGVCVYRQFMNTVNGRKFLIDGIHTVPAYRSKGVGKAIMDELKSHAARDPLVKGLVASVGTEQPEVARFMMKERFSIVSFSFTGSAAAQGVREPPASAAPALPPVVIQYVTNESGQVTAEGAVLLTAAEGVHRQLRTGDLIAPGSAAYAETMHLIFAEGGRMLVAVRPSDEPTPVIVGLCVYRYYNDLVTGARRNWVDDLITDSTQRSGGVGHALLEGVRTATRGEGLAEVQLDSGVYRKGAHRFYFKEGMTIDDYNFYFDATNTKQ